MTKAMADSTPFNPEELMALAVEVMRQSEPEPRADNKAVPRVGAVLWRRANSPYTLVGANCGTATTPSTPCSNGSCGMLD